MSQVFFPDERTRRRAQRAWALSAWANHAFITTVVVGFFPILLGKYWAAGVPGTTSTFYLGLANSSATLVVMLCAPWLGALADRRGQKKRWFGVFTALGVVATLKLAFVGPGAWPQALLLFALGSIGFWAGSSFQDALMMHVAEARESNRVSSLGFAAGYLGGGLLFLFNVMLALHPKWFGFADAMTASRMALVDVAVWWVVFSIPLFRHVPEASPTTEPPGWRELLATLRHVLSDRPVRRFLIAYWLYIDAINTLQLMAVDFGNKLGFAASTLIQAVLLVQFVAFPFALLFGKLADRIGTLRAIQLGLAVFLFVTAFGYFMQTEWQFYFLAVLLGMVQGGVQALSRSYFAGLIPRERAGEYFGFYNMLGKFAAVLGPLVVGAVAMATRNQRASILSLSLFFVAGMWLLARSGRAAHVD